MGIKGAKRSEDAVREQEAVVALLAPLGEIESRSQFGGYGVFADSKMFGLITSDGVLHFKVDDSNRGDYEQNSQFGKMPYCRVPAEVRASTRRLRSWAKKAIAVAHGR